MHSKGLIALALAALAAGCAASREGLVQRLRADNPRDQAAAIAEVVRQGDRTMAGELFDLLESPDEGVRFMAAAGLHKLTGKDFGFQFAKPQERKAIAARWRAWWEEESRPGGQGSKSNVPSDKSATRTNAGPGP